MQPAEVDRQYREVHELWEKAAEADQAHDCRRDEDFVVCDICQASSDAMNALHFQCLSTVVPLVEAQHELLKDLVRQVIQTVPFAERAPELQQAMLRGLNAVGSVNGEVK